MSPLKYWCMWPQKSHRGFSFSRSHLAGSLPTPCRGVQTTWAGYATALPTSGRTTAFLRFFALKNGELHARGPVQANRSFSLDVSQKVGYFL